MERTGTCGPLPEGREGIGQSGMDVEESGVEEPAGDNIAAYVNRSDCARFTSRR